MMLLGRTTELQSLEEMYSGEKNSLTILYGRSNIGKTSVLKEFREGKECIYYISPLASGKEQLQIFKNTVVRQLSTEIEEEVQGADGTYESVLRMAEHQKSDVKLIIIEEFQNIVKGSPDFMNAVSALVKGELISQQVMVILTSSSISWIENSLVSAIGANAYSISAFLKLKELSFVDTVRLFPKYSVEDCMRLYAITGGVPGYMAAFKDSVSLKENICSIILSHGAFLRNEGASYVKEELRETSLYNTILHCIANGNYKLNELHAETGFGRDKISVYLKNLIEREIVEKIYSYDTGGHEHTRKGLYRIKAGFLEFCFRYIYANESELSTIKPEEFYDLHIKDTLDIFAADTFVKIGTEFIELLDVLGQLQISIDKKGRWWGKNGDIDIIACDKNNKYVIGKCCWIKDVFTFEMFEELMLNVSLADIGKDYIYLFSKGTFDSELTRFAADNDNISLISIEDL